LSIRYAAACCSIDDIISAKAGIGFIFELGDKKKEKQIR